MSIPVGLQSASDFFKSDRIRIQIVLGLVKFGAFIILLLLYFSISSIMQPDVLTRSNLWSIFEIIFLILFAIMIGLLTFLVSTPLVLFSVGLVPLFLLRKRMGYAVITLGVTGILAGLYFMVSYQDPEFIVDFLILFRAFINTFMFNDIEINTPGLSADLFLQYSNDPFGPLTYLFTYEVRIAWERAFVRGIVYLALIGAVITGLNFIIRGKVSQAMWSFFLSQLVIGIAYLNELVLPLTLDKTSIGSLMGSTLFQLGLISYLYLEYSLQTGYLNEVAEPALERQKRVGKQLSLLSQFRLGISKLGTQEDQMSRQLKKLQETEDSDEDKKNTALTVGGSGSRTSRKFGAEALVFLLDSTKDSLFGSAEGEKEKMTGRLQRYHDGLLRHDSRLDDKLGGSTGKTFNPFLTTFYTLLSLIFRLSLLIVFAWIVLNAEAFYTFIAFPETIINSIEFGEPEAVILVLLPLVCLIIGVSIFITKLQSALIKAEELIISESEIQKLLKRGKAVTSREEKEKQDAQIATAGITPQQQQKTGKKPQRKFKRKANK
jgi:hypothetical protein